MFRNLPHSSPRPFRLSALAALAALAGASPVRAANLDAYYGLGPPRAPARVEVELPPPPVRLRPPPVPYATRTDVVEEREVCRVFMRPRIDVDGREVLHRVRVCDEGVVEAPRRAWVGSPPQPGFGPRGPVPPRAIDPDLDDEPG
jgi:hypothetical protein